MLAHYTRCAHVSSASARPSRPQSVICLARSSNTTTTNNNSVVERSTAAGLAAALSACVVLSTPLSASAAASAPEPERRSFGAERTAKLIEESGTPGAVRPDNMKTNIPFQAPGINAPPRGPGQQKGTSPKKVFGNIKKTIKEQYPDPDSAPFGISKGPLVKDAKKMSQPGNVGNLNKEAVRRFKNMSADTAAAKAVEADPAKSQKRGIINGSFTTMFGGRNQ